MLNLCSDLKNCKKSPYYRGQYFGDTPAEVS